MLDNFDNDRNTLPGVKHTAWGAYNAVSEWADHQRKFRGGSPADKLDRQLDSVWFGQSHQIKQAAYRGALELAGVACKATSPRTCPRCAWRRIGAGWGAVVKGTPPNKAIHIHKEIIMASFNRVILMGNLTRDPELRTLPNSDTQVCDFSLAVNRRWKDANGGDREEVLFIDCAAFGRTGQTIGESLTKGRPIHIEGRLKFEQWEQEDGQRRSKIRVVVEQFRFVDAKPGSSESGNGRAKPSAIAHPPGAMGPAEPVDRARRWCKVSWSVRGLTSRSKLHGW